VSMFRRPGPRFLLWVVVLVGVATAAGFAHFAWWLIAVLEFAAWALVAVVERSLSQPSATGRGAPPLPPPPLPEYEELSYVRVLEPGGAAARSEQAPEPVVEPEPEPEPELPVVHQRVPAPAPVIVAVPPLLEERPERKSGLISRPFRSAGGRPEPSVSRRGRTFGSQPREWNIWTLERVAREQAGDNDELGFLVTYLRDYANPDGMLPTNFDSLVRESFGDLLGYATV
jgi:hypothetical protein